MKRFLVPAKYQMKAPSGIEDVAGAVILPCGIASHTLGRRDLHKHKHLEYRIIDPQLYLGGLTPSMCRKTCANLATYPWFNVGSVPRFNSSDYRQPDFARKLKANIHKIWPAPPPLGSTDITRLSSLCINFQVQLNCNAILLPTPLIVDQGDDIATQLEWLDVGLECFENYPCDAPIYATIAISDVALRSTKPDANQLLDVLIDQVTSRKFHGAYITLEQTSESGYYCMHPNTVGAMLRLVWGLKQGGINDVVLGPMGALGFLCLAAGANAWTAGWYRGERRVKLSDMEGDEDDIKHSIPTYYSHNLASEIHTKEDLDAISKLEFFEAVVDITADSNGLIDALRNGRKVKSVPQWEYRPSNVSAAKGHFARSLAHATNVIGQMNDADVTRHIYNWIANADELATRIKEQRNCNARTELNHQSNWLEAFVTFRKYSGT